MTYIGQLVRAGFDGKVWLCVIKEENGFDGWSYGVDVVAELDGSDIIRLVDPPYHKGLNSIHDVPMSIIRNYSVALNNRSKSLDPEMKKYTIKGKIL